MVEMRDQVIASDACRNFRKSLGLYNTGLTRRGLAFFTNDSPPLRSRYIMSLRRLAAFIIVVFTIARPIWAADAPSAKPTIAVFTLNGPLSESPVEESLPLFSPPGTSLHDLTARMTKAAQDPGVKAVVLLAENA